MGGGPGGGGGGGGGGVARAQPGSGLTAGSVYIAEYNNDSAVAYSEMIFICAQVKYGGEVSPRTRIVLDGTR